LIKARLCELDGACRRKNASASWISWLLIQW
jgi:hypothetical protein